VSSEHVEDGRGTTLGDAVEQTVAVVETCTDDTHCNRFGSIECGTWTDVMQCTDMKVAGTGDAGYTSVRGKCLVKLNANYLN